MFALFCFVNYLLIFTKQGSFAKTPLSHFVQHYETLNYAAKPKIYRRDADSMFSGTHFLEFTAHGRKFELALRPDIKTVAPDAEIVDGNGKRIDFDRNSLLVGEVVGEPGSIVHGVLHENGLFTGKIHTKGGVYYIESAERYFDSPSGFHSVIYKDEDVKYDIQFAEPKIAPVDTGLYNRNYLPEEGAKSSNTRNRRATGDKKDNVCRLSMEADFTFLKYAKDAILAVGEILKHVQALNIIYGHTFNTSDTYSPYSLQFHVGLLQVHDKKQTPPGLQRENIDSSTFLSMMSKKDYSKFCQAMYFTHRDFTGGILGLAWIGYPEGRAGGMCDPRRGSKSYNTAIVTFTLQGRTSPPKVSEITFAHEVGHAFGAAHDEDECIPGGERGNYIMYDKATSGDRYRNDRFSPCSIRQIMANVDAKRGKVLDQRAKSRPRLCLESYDRMIKRGDVCGNGVVEGDEECDCGHEDQCQTFEPNACCNWRTCRLNTGKTCSPSQGPCCNKDCQATYENTICEYGNDCLEDAKCPSLQERNAEGIKHYTCPDRKPLPNGTECEGGALLCHKGLCSRSICTKHALKPCECKDVKEECHACCIDNGVCRSAYKIDKMKRATPYNYSVGSACANNTGYCDFFQYCQRVDLEGPLLQLFNLYFTEEGIRELTRKYWWAILLATLGLIAVVVLLVVYGARYTGTDNPDGKPAKPLPTFCCCSSDQSDGPPATRMQEMKDSRGDHPL